MKYCRLVVTATNRRWLDTGLREFCGYGSSVIGCDAEIGVERYLDPDETDDGRVGASVLAFGFSTDALEKALINRTGQCVMTCPSTAVFDGLGHQRFAVDHPDQVPTSESPPRIALGSKLRYFGDGYQKSKLLGDRRFWRVPVMDGEFLVEDSLGIAKGVAGGNFLILATDPALGLTAAERAVAAIEDLPGVILPFPGGVVRSGSKVGSKYSFLKASTADAWCPALIGRVESKLPGTVNCVYEIVIDGIDETTVAGAMNVGVGACVGEGIHSVSAGNYGGKLGKFHFHLHEIVTKRSDD